MAKRLLPYQTLAFITHYTWKNVKSSCNNNKFKILNPTWNDKFELPDESYSVLGIQDYFEYILKKAWRKYWYTSIRIYAIKLENRITFKIKTGYYLELLTAGTTKLLGNTKNKTTKDKNGENIPHLEITEVVLVHCNIANNDYQQDSRALYTFIPNKLFGSLLEISPTNHIFFKAFNSELQINEVWFTDQNSHPLEIEDRLNLILVLK